MISPWRLTQGEADVCDQFVVRGGRAGVDVVLGIPMGTVETRLRRAMRKMSAANRAALKSRWQEFRRREWREALAKLDLSDAGVRYLDGRT